MSQIISKLKIGNTEHPLPSGVVFTATTDNNIDFAVSSEIFVYLYSGLTVKVILGSNLESTRSTLAFNNSNASNSFPIYLDKNRTTVDAYYDMAGAPVVIAGTVAEFTFDADLPGWLVSYTPSYDTKYSAATTSAAGLMSKEDKSKLDGIATGANKYSLPTAASGTLGGIKTGYGLNGKNYPVQVDGSGNAYVNVPWTDNNTTYNVATSTTHGLMSKTDKASLDAIVAVWTADGTTDTLVNKVQEVLTVFENYPEGDNLVEILATKADKDDLATVATSGSYNDLTNKPTIPTVPSSLKNPYKITIQTNGSDLITYDGSAAKTINIKPSTLSGGAFIISDGTTDRTIQLFGEFTDTTYSAAKYNTLGLLKPAYTSTGAATLTTTAASNTNTPTIAAKTTTSGRYYAVEADKNGVAYVNVPWSNTTYSSKTEASGGTDVSLVTTGEKYTWNSKAAGDHTHTSSIAESSGTATVTLASGKKYALSAGGSSVIFAMPSFASSSHNHNSTYAPLSHSHTCSGTVTLTQGTDGGGGNYEYVESISGSAPSLGGTTEFVTGYSSFSGGSGSLTTNTTSTNGIKYVESITGGSGSLKSYDAATSGNAITSSGRIAYVADVSHTAATLTGTTTFVSAQGTFSKGTLPALTVTEKSPSKISNWSAGSATTASVANGVLTITNGSAPSLTYAAESVGSASGWSAGSLPSLGAATTAQVGISGGSISKTVYYLDHAHTAAGSTTKYLHHGHTAASLGTADKGTVTISGGSYSATKKYLARTLTYSGTTN